MFRASLCPPSGEQQCRTPYAAVHTIFLLMMGIMMPETCCDSFIINIRLVTSCWSLSLHPKYNIKYDDGPLSQKLVINSRVTIKYYVVVSYGVHVQFVLLIYFEHNEMSSTKILYEDKSPSLCIPFFTLMSLPLS